MNQLDGFAEALARATDIAAVQSLFAAEIAPFGFDASACGCFLPTDTGPLPHFFFIGWPADWLQIYAERNFIAYDFAVAEARRRIFPFTWTEAQEGRVLSQGERAIWDAALARGWRNGLFVPVHGPGGYMGIIAMAGVRDEIAPAARRHLHMAGLLTHEKCRQLAGVSFKTHTGEPLSARELECLRWVAAGKSDGEIAQILELSQTTVKFHVDNGREKLGASSRAHAVARLVAFGLS